MTFAVQFSNVFVKIMLSATIILVFLYHATMFCVHLAFNKLFRKVVKTFYTNVPSPSIFKNFLFFTELRRSWSDVVVIVDSVYAINTSSLTQLIHGIQYGESDKVYLLITSSLLSGRLQYLREIAKEFITVLIC